MNNDFIALLKERVDIVDIINQYVPLRHSGNNYKACCPFHKEKTPSFMVNPQTQSFKCFGCGKGGDVYTFIQEIEHIEFFDAVTLLADKFGMEIPRDRDHNPKQKATNAEIKEINLLSARYFYKKLIQTTHALDYLKKRGVSPQMIREFGLGYADDSGELIEMLRSRFSEERILESGIANKKENRLQSVFRDRIIFPIFNSRNEIIAFGGRQLGEWGPKYLNSPETPIYQKKENLYGIQIARKNIRDRTVFLVEGYMDVISMHQNGYRNTVATLGTALTESQGKILSKMADYIMVLYDSDNAGQNAAKKAIELIEQTGASARVVELTGAKDPDEFFKKKSASEFTNCINSSKDYLKFNISYIQNQYDIATNIGKENFVKEAVSFIKHYQSKSFARQIYIEEAIYYLSEATGYSTKSIGTDIFGKYFSPKMFRKERSIEEPKSSALQLEIEPEIDKKEKTILWGLSNNLIAFDEIGIEDFVYPINRKLYFEIKSGLQKYDLNEIERLSQQEYSMLIKSIKQTKLGIRISFLENVQNQLLRSKDGTDATLALMIGKEIIRLNGLRNNL